MKNKEIEELLNELKEVTNSKKLSSTYCITNKHWQLLLSYIEQLEKENQQLKENYDRIYNENCKLREEHNITDISLLDENYKLKKQKDDVVEYIKENKANFTCMRTTYLKCMNDLLRMLGEIDDK